MTPRHQQLAASMAAAKIIGPIKIQLLFPQFASSSWHHTRFLTPAAQNVPSSARLTSPPLLNTSFASRSAERWRSLRDVIDLLRTMLTLPFVNIILIMIAIADELSSSLTYIRSLETHDDGRLRSQYADPAKI